MYSLELTEEAEDSLKHLDKKDAEFILKVVNSLKDNPFRFDLKRLKGYKLWRLKIKEYRAILDIMISGKTITVLAIGHRRSVYSDFLRKRK